MDTGKIKHLMNKSLETLQEEGIQGFARKTKNYVTLRVKKQKMASVKDILFINGCMLPHPQRYRVDHQMEQLDASGFTTNRVDYDKLSLDFIKYYRGFVFFRCPITPVVEEFINEAKKQNKKVFFDVDDLVIDTKYTKDIKAVKKMNKEERQLYDDGVNRMRATLEKCDYAITTTDRLQQELKNYIKEVYINRNVASEEMVALSLKASKQIKRNPDKVIMGYLSGSITHNADFELILPVVKKLMKEHKNLYLKIVGLLDIPTSLEPFKERIIAESFVDWRKLPKLVASVDINLAPLESSIFNEAKSENKWVEAALCNVVTVASNVGAFQKITDYKTGLLCDSKDEWYQKLNEVIKDANLRQALAMNAHKEVMEKYITTYTGGGLAHFLQSKLNPNIAFVLPTTNVSGGMNVIFKHCAILKKAGYDVTLINMDNNGENINNPDGTLHVINSLKTDVLCYFDKMVATLWATLDYVKAYPNVCTKKYLVQGFETDFMKHGDPFKYRANSTYHSLVAPEYLTVSKWCQGWLKEKYGRDAKYVPNGIKLEQFPVCKREFKGKIKILIEGNCADRYKNVDESFKIVEKLDKERFEIYFLSYQGKPKDWYYVDHFMHKVPYEKVGEIYGKCDILLKTSILESFSYPPLEMMATGGISVVVPNDGNVEYLKDEENCLFYEQGNIDEAVKQIERIATDATLRKKLIANGLKTAKSRDWKKIEKDIIKLYE